VVNSPLKTGSLQRLALRLRPELAQYTGVERAGHLLNIYTALLTSPVAIIGITWLGFETDFEVLRQNGLFLLLLLGVAFLFDRYPFEIQLELRPGTILTTGGTLLFVFSLSAVFIFGPTAYWLDVLPTLLTSIFFIAREQNTNSRWARFTTLMVNLSNGTISVLAALWVYQQIGGVFPLPNLELTSVWPATVALLINWLLPFVIMIPFVYYIASTPEFIGTDSVTPKNFIFFLFISSSLPNLALPFTLLAAALYTRNSAGYFLFFTSGILLACILASRLTDIIKQRAQRARELAALEELGRDIITAPPDLSTLPEILTTRIPNMFISGRTLIWLDPDQTLYRSPNTEYPPLDQIRAPLARESVTHYVYPRGQTDADPLRAGLSVPIHNPSGDRVGGVYFTIRQDIAQVKDYLPALQSLAAQIASALYRAETHKEALLKERMSNELELAGRIQANFLPEHIPSLRGYEIAASLTPALQTSGDFYDFVPLPNGKLGVLIADVADKGTGAALFMALTRTLLRTYAIELPNDPALAFLRTNIRVHQDTQSQLFITTFYGIIDPFQHTLTYVNGGHNPPYLFRASLLTAEPADSLTHSPAESLTRTGIPIGMLEEAQWEHKCISFHPGDLLILYTDGVTEAQNATQEFFEEAGLIETGKSCLGSSAQETHDAILRAIRSFVGDAPQFDDITLMIIRRVT
jgi:serine phosphatase RsbU (regulator of sigma subunit)